MDRQLYGTLLDIPDRIEDKDEKVKSLRELRNSYYQKASEIQKQIDDRIIELHQVPDLNNKFIKYSSKENTYYFKVNTFERLIKGVKIVGFCCITSIYGSLNIYQKEFLLVDWNNIQDIVVIEECDFITAISNAFTNVVNSYKDEV